MKRVCSALLLAALLLGAAARPARAEPDRGFVRLHVVAASNSTADQAAKLRVRDACLRRAREVLADCPDADAAWRTLRADREGFARAARAAAPGTLVRVQTGVFPFPDRVYGNVLVPAGEYRALRVVLGPGAGHNWWCMLYPSLCVLDENVYASGEDVEIEFYSAVWEWLQQIFHNQEDE